MYKDYKHERRKLPIIGDIRYNRESYMKAHYYRILFLTIFIAFSYSKAFGSDYFFYKCNPKKQEFKLKALYFYTLNEQMHKSNTIQALQKSG